MEGIDPYLHSEALRTQAEARKRIREKKTGKIQGGKQFSDRLMESSQTEGYISLPEETLEEMLDDLHRRGEELKREPTFAHMKQYRQSVRHFLSYVVKKGVGLEEQVSGFNIMKRKRYYLIRVIDEKLERLASGILQEQVEQMDILGKVDEIHGMIIDLVR